MTPRDALPPTSPELHQLLSAAAAPGHPDELAALPAALTAFSLTPTPTLIRSTMSGIVSSLVAVKTMVVVAGTSFLGGVALAASTGTLPVQVQNVAHESLGAPAPASQSAADTDEGKAAPQPSLAGLCRAYAHGNKGEHGKALDSPAFTALITAAGGKGSVVSYCAGLPPKEHAPGDEGKDDADDKANQGKSHKPENAGKPDHTGKPEGKGKPTEEATTAP